MLTCILFGLLFSCANPIPPTGGPRDETPPRLDTLNSTRNLQTRFQKQPVVLAFDEWVELKDVFNQVIVSPPLEFRPEITRKKKTIQFKFDDREKLRDSATYVINFGNAIQDLTESNPAPISFVFSTGDYIDSLSVGGRIVDAASGEPVKDVLFLLYENLADSAFRTERPFYFARTGEDGSFQVNNIKAGTFKATALIDQNLNYKFDSQAEKIAFLDSTVTLGRTNILLPDMLQVDTLQVDSLSQQPTTNNQLPKPLTLRLFEEEKTLFLQDSKAEKYGLVKLAFNREPFDAKVTFDSIGQTVFFENEKDSIRLWYFSENDSPWNVYVQRDTMRDTVQVLAGLRQIFMETDSLVPAAKPPSRPPVQVPGQPFGIVFNHPLAAFDASQIQLLEDSMRLPVRPVITIDTALRRKLLVNFDWKEGVKYEAVLPPGSITDVFGLVNTDTETWFFTAGAAKDFGTLNLKVQGLRPDTSYVIRLLTKDGTVLRSFKASGPTDFSATLPLMAPGTFTVELIEDLDGNGRWTTGKYDLHRQPERVHRKTLEELRANWELEATVEWSGNPAPASTGSTPPSTLPPRGEGGGNRPPSGRGNR